MAKKANSNADDLLSVMTDLLITQLAVAGVQQQTIRRILGCYTRQTLRVLPVHKSVQSNPARAYRFQ